MLKFDYGERHRYDDIIDLPRPVSKTHSPMPSADRAAQFAPFAALTGHGEAVKETARLTGKRIELDESCKAVLDDRLKKIREALDSRPAAVITYFVPDSQKEGGVYEEAAGRVVGIDGYLRQILFEDGRRISMDEIIGIESQDIVFSPEIS